MMKQAQQKGYISRKEAAEMLCCHPQSISNYAGRGYFKTLTVDRCVLVEKKSFDAFLSAHTSEVKTLEQIQADVESLKQMAREEETKIRKQIEFMRGVKEYLTFIKFGYPSDLLHEFLCMISETVDKESAPITAQAVSMIDDFVRGASYEEVEEKYNISHYTSCRQSWRGMAYLRKNRHFLSRLIKENTSLKQRCATQHKALQQYRHENNMLAKRCPTKEQQYELSKTALAMAKTEKLHLKNYDISVRMLNVCRCHNVDTVRDLLACSERDILTWVNCGKKTIAEITDFVKTFRMEHKEYDYHLGCFETCA